MGDLTFLPTAREIAAAAHVAHIHKAPVVAIPALDGPRYRFLVACLRLETLGIEAGGAAKRIYGRSSLTDEIALPDVDAAGRILRLLAPVDAPEARQALQALGDMLADPITPEAA